MDRGRSTRVWLLALVALPWAGTLTVGGLWLLLVGRLRYPGWTAEALVAGIAALAAGYLVFSACVADRAFPLASSTLGAWMEVVATTVLLLACASLGVLLVQAAA